MSGTYTLNTFEFETVKIKEIEVSSGFLGFNKKKAVSNRERKQAKYFTEDLGDGITLDMVEIPGGTFIMGTKEGEIKKLAKKRKLEKYEIELIQLETPQHKVTIPSFYMGKFQVTQTQWKQVAALPQVNKELDSDLNTLKEKDFPVDRVEWDEAVEFCQRLSIATGKEYRLPSEAEWEYACKAGTTTPFYFGETITTNLANYNGESSTPVGSFPPNAFGLYDMHGNVLESCADSLSSIYNHQRSPEDGSPLVEKGGVRVARGGSCNRDSIHCRSSCRCLYMIVPDEPGYPHIGFRCVVSKK